MIALIQRVTRASVTVEGEVTGEIGAGLLVLLGVEKDDDEQKANRLCERVLGYRIFSDAEGKMNLNVQQAGGSVLLHHLRGGPGPDRLGHCVLLFHRTGFDLQCPVRTSFPVGRAAVYGHVRPVPPGGGAEGGQRSDHLRGRGHGDCSQSGCDDGQAEDVPQ